MYEKGKHPGGAPRQYDRELLREKLIEYIEITEIPILAEFAYTMRVPRQYLYEMEELIDAIKLCNEKKQCALESGTLTGKLNPSMAIFSLKQLGWTDRVSQEISGPSGGPVQIASTRSLTDAELLAIATGSSKRAADPQEG